MQEPLKKIIAFILKTIRYGFLGNLFLLWILSLPYALFTSIYDFPNAIPFSGKSWHNPYRSTNLLDTSAWKKSNFHGHTKAWGGLTDGKSQHEIFLSAYRAMNYHTVGLSNYQFIDTSFALEQGYIPCYEHGYNVWKRHHVCIGAKEVTWLDFIFGQSIHHKQTMLDKINPSVEVLAIAHPRFRGSFEPEDFSVLTNYDCIEVLNHYRISEVQWDSALSAGRKAWIIGDDDTHNVRDEGETGVCWTMIYAKSKTDLHDLTQSLRSGMAYGVQGKRGAMGILPKALGIKADSLYQLETDIAADSIILIGQSGKVLSKVFNASTIEYPIKKSDTYIRAKIFCNENTLWMNPVFRNGNNSYKQASPNLLYTFAYRAMWFALYGIIGFIVYRFRKTIFP